MMTKAMQSSLKTWVDENGKLSPPGATTYKDTSFNQFDIRGCVLKIQYKKSEKRKKEKEKKRKEK